MKRVLQWLSGFSPLWLDAVLLALDAKNEMEEASRTQAGT